MNQRPYWVLLPHVNNRTAWKPVKFPAILVIPFGANVTGQPLAQTAPSSVSISVLDVINRNRVAGHQHSGVYSPDRELFRIDLSSIEIGKRLIDIKDFPVENGKIRITSRSGVSGNIDIADDGLYYDFSDIEVGVDNLPHGRYQLNYSATVNKRVYDTNGGLICVDSDNSDSIITNIDFVHPGEVIAEMVKNSPSIWFRDGDLKDDPILKLYKPLTDVLQNIYDEQTILSRINFVNHVYPEAVPYLGQILGWEIPYFPKSLDQLRKAVLRTTTEFQKNRGSLSSIRKLFDLFGFDILIRNLWTALDNKTLLEPRTDNSNGIGLVKKIQFDVLNAGLISPGFYGGEVPLLRQPSRLSPNEDNFIELDSDVTVQAYAVILGSASHVALDAFIEQFRWGIDPDISHTTSGFVNNDIDAVLEGLDVHASQTIDIKTDRTLSSSHKGWRRIILEDSVEIDIHKPSIKFTLDGHWDDQDVVVYLFATYESQMVVLSDELKDRRSNYFDIKLSTVDGSSFNELLSIEYVLEFLFRLKAFHSLLRRIFVTIESRDVYLVTDYCYGPRLSQPAGSDIGSQQVPPAVTIKPNDDNICDIQDAELAGYKLSDIKYRDGITAGLIEEWESYLAYDQRQFAYDYLKSLLVPNYPDDSRNVGRYNEFGQDAFYGEYDTAVAFLSTPHSLSGQYLGGFVPRLIDFDNATNANMSIVDLGTYEHYMQYSHIEDLADQNPICFRGRVRDELSIATTSPNRDQYSLRDCHMGVGEYFTTPRHGVLLKPGSSQRSIGSRSLTSIASNGTAIAGGSFDGSDYAYGHVGLSPSRISGNSPDILHYWDRPEPADVSWNSAANKFVNLDVRQAHMHFPGTRFINISNYNGEFISPTHDLRPWDEDICNSRLEATISVGEDGNEFLVFDKTPFSFTGNGLDPDISNLDVHVPGVIDPNHVIHTIYSKHADANSPELSPYPIDVGDDGIGEVTYRIFNSATDINGVLMDYLDGNPCITGFVSVSSETGSVYYDSITLPPQFLFLVSSGVVDGSIGIRLDCGAIQPIDSITGITDNGNARELSDIDSVGVATSLVMSERIGVEEVYLDGEIKHLLPFKSFDPTIFQLT